MSKNCLAAGFASDPDASGVPWRASALGYTMRMSDLSKLQKDLLRLPANEREALALSAWSSLGRGSDPAINAQLDPEGIDLAKERDQQIDSGSVNPISHTEFLRRTRHGQ